MEQVYRRMITWLTSEGLTKRSAQTPLEYAAQVRRQANAERSTLVDEISRHHVAWRYGNVNPDLDHMHQCLQQLQTKAVQKTT